MRWILLTLLALAPYSQAQFVQCQNHSSSSSIASEDVTITSTAGHALKVLVRVGATGSAGISITDSAGNTYSSTPKTPKSGPGSTAPTIGMYYVANAAAVTTVTAHYSPNAAASSVIVCEFSGMATSSLLDNTDAEANATSVTTLASGALTTLNANDVLFDGIGMNASVTAFACPAGWTLPTNGSTTSAGVCYKIVSATQSGVTVAPTWTTARDAAELLAGFKILIPTTASPFVIAP